MIYYFEGHYDPMAINRMEGHLQADNIYGALHRATRLLHERAEAVHAKPEYARITLLKETSIKLLLPRGTQ